MLMIKWWENVNQITKINPSNIKGNFVKTLKTLVHLGGLEQFWMVKIPKFMRYLGTYEKNVWNTNMQQSHYFSAVFVLRAFLNMITVHLKMYYVMLKWLIYHCGIIRSFGWSPIF